MISVDLNSIPEFLKKSELYKNISSDETIHVPKKLYCQSIQVNNINDLINITHVMRYWMVNQLPQEVINYLTNNSDCELDFVYYDLSNTFKDFPSIDLMRALTLKDDREKICCLAECGAIEQIKPMIDNGYDLKKTNESNYWCYWYENLSYLAAKNNHLKCLEFLHNHGCIIDSKTMNVAIENNNLEIIKYLNSKGIDVCINSILSQNNLQLLKRVFDLNLCCNKNINTYRLSDIMKNNKYNCLKLLIDNECELNYDEIFNNYNYDIKMLKLLLDYLKLNNPIFYKSKKIMMYLALMNIKNTKILFETMQLDDKEKNVIMSLAIRLSSLKIVKYLHEEIKIDFNDNHIQYSCEKLEMLKYVYSKTNKIYSYVNIYITKEYEFIKFLFDSGYTINKYQHDSSSGYLYNDSIVQICEKDDLCFFKYLNDYITIVQCKCLFTKRRDPIYIDKNKFASSYIFGLAIENGSINIIKHLYDLRFTAEKNCLINKQYKNIDTLKYLVLHGCEYDSSTFWYAAQNNYLDCVKFLHEYTISNSSNSRNNIWDFYTTLNAADHEDRLELFKYTCDNGCPIDEEVTYRAVRAGNFEALKYIHEHVCYLSKTQCKEKFCSHTPCKEKFCSHTPCKEKFCSHTPWDRTACKCAIIYGRYKCLRYMYENGCRWTVFEFGDWDKGRYLEDEESLKHYGMKDKIMCIKYAFQQKKIDNVTLGKIIKQEKFNHLNFLLS